MAVVTTNACSKRIMAAHSSIAMTTATAIDVMAQGLNISQAGIPAASATRPPIQNQPGG